MRSPRQDRRWLQLAGTLCMSFAPALAPAQVFETEAGLQLRTSTDQVEIRFCDANVIHVVARPAERPASTLTRPWIRQACKGIKPNLERAPPAAGGASAQAPGGNGASAAAGWVIAEAGSVKLSISEANGNIVFMAPDGTRLLGEVGNDPRHYRAGTVESSLLDVEVLFHPMLRQGIYGLGQHQSGVFNYQGSVVELAQSNTDIAIPFMVSTAGYGLFWNSAAASRFDNRFPTELKITAESTDGIDYYFVYGPEMDRLIAHYRSLTGAAPLFPRWTYGLFQSMDHYASAEQLERAVDMNRSGHAPMVSSCRTGAGGSAWATRSSRSNLIPMCPRCSIVCRIATSTP